MKRKEKKTFINTQTTSFKNRNKISFHGVISWKADFFLIQGLP